MSDRETKNTPITKNGRAAVSLLPEAILGKSSDHSDVASPVITADTKRKILNMEALAQVVAAHQAEGQTVALCHGVFDLLHIGHIRHFEEAKKHGDVLIVTISADRYVNKGPLRPAFPEGLRAEAIAALNCVDYVAINHSPMAIELIEQVRPNFYVKGAEYADAKKDVTGGIDLERAAIESVGGRLVFTDDIVFSSSTLINRHMPVLSRDATEFLDRFATRYCANDVSQYFDKMKALKVLIVGEAIIDEYHYCQAIGKSSKEPTLVLKQLSQEQFAGGILAVANNLTDFCDNIGIATLIGDNDEDERFVQANISDNVEATLQKRISSPTIRKTRFIDNASRSKLLELYAINDSALTVSENHTLCATLEQAMPHYDVVIVVDYGHGMLGAEAAQIISSRAMFLAVNTQSNAASLGYQTVSKYQRADYLCLTENEARLEARDRTGPLESIITGLAEQLGCRQVVVTRGKRGSICYSNEEGLCEVPSFSGPVVDSVGAGDAFLSVTSLAAALAAPNDMLGFIGNTFGAQAVATVGHRESISRVRVTKFITSLLK